MDEIETPRLRLRRFTPADLDELALIFSDPLVMKYLWPSRSATRVETESALLSMISHWEAKGYGRWAVVHRATGKLIGYSGLRSFDGTPELVYLLARPFWNCGLATEMARASLDYGFTQHNFEQIIALTQPDNLASRRVMEKVGLTFSHTAKFFDLDVVLYAITRLEYFSHSFVASAQDSLPQHPALP